MREPISLLIKPASGACQLRCKYCFYEDELSVREEGVRPMMSEETLEALVKRALGGGFSECSLMFQGGEPTLAGLSFFRRCVELVKKHNTDNIPVHYSLQTNGQCIDAEWADFFLENKFLIGLSLDGDKAQNDLYRVGATDGSSYSAVMRAAQLFSSRGVEFNILTVVTAQTAKNIGRIYGFFMRNGFTYQQYVPCLDPISEAPGGREYSLTPELYERFLKTLFDLWYQDRRRGRFVYNRYFENLAAMLLGQRAESCELCGQCSRQYVVEADGSVYPCDFYALDKYLLGSLVTEDFAAIDKRREELRFTEPDELSPECSKCEWLFLCRGGCRRYKEGMNGRGMNYHCKALKGFFPYAVPRLRELI